MTTAEATPRHKPDEVDRDLLNALQAGIALVPHPYREVGGRIGLTEEQVLDRMSRLKEGGIIRQVSAIFDTRALGYESSLVAARYPEDKLFEGASIVGGHPGVSHNYRRTHAFNLWFTVAVEPESRMGLQATVDALQEASGAESMRLLPTLKLYKINVQLDMTGSQESTAKEEAPREAPQRGDGALPTERDKEFIQILQRDLPLVSEPFHVWSQESGRSVGEILEAAETFAERTYMRRFAAVLNHRRAGFGANGMAVWKVPEERLEELGPQMAAFKAVSHCYRRPTYPDWPYNLFTMVHSTSMDACEETIAAIAADSGLDDPDQRAVLYSTLEFKKIRLVYYTPEYREWEELALSGGELPRWTRP